MRRRCSHSGFHPAWFLIAQPGMFAAFLQFNDKSMTPVSRVAPFCCTSRVIPLSTASGRRQASPSAVSSLPPKPPKTPTGSSRPTHPKPKLNFPFAPHKVLTPVPSLAVGWRPRHAITTLAAAVYDDAGRHLKTAGLAARPVSHRTTTPPPHHTSDHPRGRAPEASKKAKGAFRLWDKQPSPGCSLSWYLQGPRMKQDGNLGRHAGSPGSFPSSTPSRYHLMLLGLGVVGAGPPGGQSDPIRAPIAMCSKSLLIA
jgi:hypothetical protein